VERKDLRRGGIGAIRSHELSARRLVGAGPEDDGHLCIGLRIGLGLGLAYLSISAEFVSSSVATTPRPKIGCGFV